MAPRFVEGDVTRLRDFGVGDGYTLLLDAGCFHTLPADLRPAYVDSVSEAAAPGSTLLLYGFVRPPRIAPMRALRPGRCGSASADAGSLRATSGSTGASTSGAFACGAQRE